MKVNKKIMKILHGSLLPLNTHQKQGQVLGYMGLAFSFAIILTIVAVAMSIGGKVTGDLRDGIVIDVANNRTLHRDIIANSTGGLVNLAGQTPIAGLVVGLSIVLLVLITLVMRNMGKGVQ